MTEADRVHIADRFRENATANTELRQQIQCWLDLRRRPEQIAFKLRVEFPDRPEIHVVHETIYQALYVQGAANSAANSPEHCGRAEPIASGGDIRNNDDHGLCGRWS